MTAEADRSPASGPTTRTGAPAPDRWKRATPRVPSRPAPAQARVLTPPVSGAQPREIADRLRMTQRTVDRPLVRARGGVRYWREPGLAAQPDSYLERRSVDRRSRSDACRLYWPSSRL